MFKFNFLKFFKPEKKENFWEENGFLEIVKQEDRQKIGDCLTNLAHFLMEKNYDSEKYNNWGMIAFVVVVRLFKDYGILFEDFEYLTRKWVKFSVFYGNLLMDGVDDTHVDIEAETAALFCDFFVGTIVSEKKYKLVKND